MRRKKGIKRGQKKGSSPGEMVFAPVESAKAPAEYALHSTGKIPPQYDSHYLRGRLDKAALDFCTFIKPRLGRAGVLGNTK